MSHVISWHYVAEPRRIAKFIFSWLVWFKMLDKKVEFWMQCWKLKKSRYFKKNRSLLCSVAFVNSCCYQSSSAWYMIVTIFSSLGIMMVMESNEAMDKPQPPNNKEKLLLHFRSFHQTEVWRCALCYVWDGSHMVFFQTKVWKKESMIHIESLLFK